MAKHFLTVCFLLYSASLFATPTTVTFVQDFGINGVVRGSFTGEDVDLDGHITFDESVAGVDTVTAYSIRFNPGSANSGDIAIFTLGLPLLDRLEYALGGTVVVVAGGEDAGTEHFYNCNNEFNCFVGDVDNIYSSGGANMVTSANRPYDFTVLRSEARRMSQTSFSTPTINNSGVAAYVVSGGFADRNLIIDDGTTQTVIDLDAAAGAGGFPGRVFINDMGAVAVGYDYRTFSFSRTGVLLRFNPDSTVTTLATYNSDGVVGDFSEIDGRSISMNNSGQIGAQVTLNSGDRAIVVIDDDGFTVVDTVTPNRFSFAGAAINEAGVVAYKATEAVPTRVGIFTGDGLSPAQIALTFPSCGGSGAGPGINVNGLVAGSSPLCLITGAGGVVAEVVVDPASNPFGASVGSLSLNNLGEVVFMATIDHTAFFTGLYFGDDPVHDKLIQQGEPLFGEIGTNIRFAGEGGMNDQAQVVFLVGTRTEAGADSTHIIRADRPLPPDTDGDGVFDANDVCPGTAPGAEVDDSGCSAAQRDTDEDGVSDAADLCPATAPSASVDLNGCADLQVDSDGDGVCDSDSVSSGPAGCSGSDVCADTAIPEAVPTASLKKNRYGLTGVPSNTIFEGLNKIEFTTSDTGGCSCEQIIDASGLGGGHLLFGCSKSVMQQWSDQLN